MIGWDYMHDDKEISVHYLVFEGEQARSERHIRRLWIVVVIMLTMFFINNTVWIWYINQYDFENCDISADNESTANYIGRDGDISNGGENQGK